MLRKILVPVCLATLFFAIKLSTKPRQAKVKKARKSDRRAQDVSQYIEHMPVPGIRVQRVVASDFWTNWYNILKLWSLYGNATNTTSYGANKPFWLGKIQELFSLRAFSPGLYVPTRQGRAIGRKPYGNAWYLFYVKDFSKLRLERYHPMKRMLIKAYLRFFPVAGAPFDCMRPTIYGNNGKALTCHCFEWGIMVHHFAQGSGIGKKIIVAVANVSRDSGIPFAAYVSVHNAASQHLHAIAGLKIFGSLKIPEYPEQHVFFGLEEQWEVYRLRRKRLGVYGGLRKRTRRHCARSGRVYRLIARNKH